MTQIKTTWDFSKLGANDMDSRFMEERAQIKKHAEEFSLKWKDRIDWLENSVVLRAALDDYEFFMRECGVEGGTEGYYFWLRGVLEQGNTDLKARNKLISDASVGVINAIDFFEIRLAKISEEKQKEMLQNENLLPYHHFLSRLFENAKFLLSEAEEKIVTHMSETSYEKWVTMVSDFISQEELEVSVEGGAKEKKSFSEILASIDAKDKNVRDDAARALNEIFKKHGASAEAELNAVFAYKKTIDELRKFTRPDEVRHRSDNIDTTIVDALRGAVTKHFDMANRYYALKAKLLGLPKLAYHERNIPYGELPHDYKFEDAVMRVEKTFSKFDPKFAEIFSRFVCEGHIDVYPKKGKASGAFCTHSLLRDPTYILMNFSGKLNDIQTLAHEVGHGINNEYMREHQNALYFGSPTSTAEVASTFFEDAVLQTYLDDANETERLTILMSDLNDSVSSIFRQIACYEFEFELHTVFREKGYLSFAEIGKIFQKNMRAYMGDAVQQDPGSENWWVYWSHIRRFFYVYSYASGLLISKSLMHFTKKDPTFIEKVKTFLSAGLSDSPRNIFLACGIDITDPAFWEEGLKAIENRLNEAEVLAKKLGKI